MAVSRLFLSLGCVLLLASASIAASRELGSSQAPAQPAASDGWLEPVVQERPQPQQAQAAMAVAAAPEGEGEAEGLFARADKAGDELEYQKHKAKYEAMARKADTDYPSPGHKGKGHNKTPERPEPVPGMVKHHMYLTRNSVNMEARFGTHEQGLFNAGNTVPAAGATAEGPATVWIKAPLSCGSGSARANVGECVLSGTQFDSTSGETVAVASCEVRDNAATSCGNMFFKGMIVTASGRLTVRYHSDDAGTPVLDEIVTPMGGLPVSGMSYPGRPNTLLANALDALLGYKAGALTVTKPATSDEGAVSFMFMT